MYTMLNVVKYGLRRLLSKEDDQAKTMIARMESSLRLDFLSGFYFKVFENLQSEEHDPKRFKLEIIVNNGAIVNPEKVGEIVDHTIPIDLDNTFSMTLTLDDIDIFFDTISSFQSESSGSLSSDTEIKPEAKDL